MNPDFPHRGRANRCLSSLVALISVVLLGGVASTASAESAKLPLLYKGNGYRLEPGLMWGWDRDGVGKPLPYLGKIHICDPAGSAVRWSLWAPRQSTAAAASSSRRTAPAGAATEFPAG